MPTKTSGPMLINDFLQHTGVNEIVEELNSHFKNKQLVVSDVTDNNGHQYVDLVQEGGGVLGVALVGYTYVLEKMGIRFFSLAGTSAGSINAMLLACTGNKEDEKVEKIVEDILGLDFLTLVDGKESNWKFTKKVKASIQKLLLKKNFFRRLASMIKWSLLTVVVLALGSFIANFFAPNIAKWIGLAGCLVLLLLIAGAVSTRNMFKEFSKNGYGLNEGKVFHQWIKKVIASNFVESDPAKGPISNMANFAQHFLRLPGDYK